MIRLCFFARFREKLGVSEDVLTLGAPLSVAEVLQILAARGGEWQSLFDCPQGVMVAINQQMGTLESMVLTGDEVALFPPVTGG